MASQFDADGGFELPETGAGTAAVRKMIMADELRKDIR